MTIGKEIYAVINPKTGEILGDGDCSALSNKKDLLDLKWVKKINDCPDAKIVKCKLVICEDE